MPITPRQLDLWSSNMSSLYNSLEGEILRIIVKRLNGGSNNILEWQVEKLQELRLFNVETAKYISQVTGVAESQVRSMFENTGVKVVRELDKQLPYDNLPLPNNLDNIMRAYSNQTWLEIDNYVNQTLLTTQFGATSQMYTSIVNETAAMFNAGIYTKEQAIEKTVQKWAQKGLPSNFVDKGGHNWTIERYTRTVLKSTLNNTYEKLRKDRMSEYGVHTVVVTNHYGARQKCSLIQGNVVDLRQTVPEDSKYKSIYDPYWKADYETAGGHRGVNCAHQHIPFIDGVNTNNQPKIDQKLNKEVEELMKKQRYYERNIIKYKKNKMVSEAMDNKEEVAKWNRKVRMNQSAVKKLTDENEYISRNYGREKVYTPLKSLLKDFNYDN